jgi:hypothetical protein
MHIGDQSNPIDLNAIGKCSGPFDIIVDDGGHSRKQQLTSIVELGKYVKPNGGIYVLEDMMTAFWGGYNDSIYSPYNFTEDILKMFYGVNSKNSAVLEFHKSLMSMSCFKEACVFVKK